MKRCFLLMMVLLLMGCDELPFTGLIPMSHGQQRQPFYLNYTLRGESAWGHGQQLNKDELETYLRRLREDQDIYEGDTYFKLKFNENISFDELKPYYYAVLRGGIRSNLRLNDVDITPGYGSGQPPIYHDFVPVMITPQTKGWLEQVNRGAGKFRPRVRLHVGADAPMSWVLDVSRILIAEGYFVYLRHWKDMDASMILIHGRSDQRIRP